MKRMTATLFAACFAGLSLFSSPLFVSGEEPGAPFIGNILSIAEFDGETDLSPSSEADIVIVHLNGEKTAGLKTEKEEIGPESFGSSVPAFYVSDANSAETAKSILPMFEPFAFIVSDNPELVKEVRTACTTVSGIIDFRDTDVSAEEMRDTANRNMAKSVLVSASEMTAENAGILKKLLINVYMDASDETEYLQVLRKGADGILYDGVCPSLTSDAQTGIWTSKPLIVSHRGNSGLKRTLKYEDGAPYACGYFENTVESARAVYDACHPDFIEIDMYVSKDGYVVIHHDANLLRMTNGTGIIENMTLEEIRRYKIDGGLEDLSADSLSQIPILDDYFEEFRQDDLMFLLEIKSARRECVDAAVEIIEKYEMEGQVNFISFNKDILLYAREKAPAISVSYLSTGGMYGYNVDSVGEILETINPLNASLSPTYSNITQSTIRAFNRCGVKLSAWTINYDLADVVASLGFSTFTTDNCDMLKSHPAELIVFSERKTVEGTAFTLLATVRLRDGTEEPASCTPLYLSEGITFENGKFTAEKDGTVVLLFRGEKYALISEPIQIEVLPAKKGCGSTLGIFSLSASVPCALALLLRKKKRP